MPLTSKWLVGITGGVATGKTTALRFLAKQGACVFNLDTLIKIAYWRQHLLIKEVLPCSEDLLSYQAHRKTILKTPEVQKKISAILYPLVRGTVLQLACHNNHCPYIVIEIPMFTRSTFWQKIVDDSVLIACPIDEQRKRLSNRSKISKDLIDLYLEAQDPLTQQLEKTKLFIVPSSLEDLKRQTKSLHLYFLKRAANHLPSQCKPAWSTTPFLQTDKNHKQFLKKEPT